MSRTYRRLRTRKGKHNQPPIAAWWPKAHCYFWDGKRTMHNTPSWWIHDFMTKPQRARTRQLLTVLYRLHDLEDAPEFPLAKKPHLYYW